MSASPSNSRVLLTVGPTREYLDDVRYFSNASTGWMGAAIAAECLARGWGVSAVCGPLETAMPAGCEVVSVTSAAEMLEAVKARFAKCDLFIAAAAVADYTPKTRFQGKLKKSADSLTIELVKTADILGWAGENRRAGQKIVGFALESGTDMAASLEMAKQKLSAKRCDLLVHNTPANFGTGGGTVTILNASGTVWQGQATKREIAKRLLGLVG